MGNNISSSTPLPVTLSDCYVDGVLDTYKLQKYLVLKRKRENEEQEQFLQATSSLVTLSHPSKKRKIRSVKKHVLKIKNKD